MQYRIDAILSRWISPRQTKTLNPNAGWTQMEAEFALDFWVERHPCQTLTTIFAKPTMTRERLNLFFRRVFNKSKRQQEREMRTGHEHGWPKGPDNHKEPLKIHESKHFKKKNPFIFPAQNDRVFGSTILHGTLQNMTVGNSNYFKTLQFTLVSLF